MKLIFVAVSLGVLLTVAEGIKQTQPGGRKSKTRQRTNEDESGFSFILDLYDRLSAENRDGNVIMSPFSVASVLALTLEGARGNTAAQLQSVLHWNSLNTTGVRESIRDALLSMNRQTNSYVLTVANHIFLQHGFDVLQGFRHNLRSFHLSDVDELDFAKDESRDVINNWISQTTRNKIPQLFGPGELDPHAKLMLLNAVYFKGDWAVKFDEKRTMMRPFFPAVSSANGLSGGSNEKSNERSANVKSSNGQFNVKSNGNVQNNDGQFNDGHFNKGQSSESITVPMMYTQAEFGYAQLDDLQCSFLELPYRGRDLAMYLLLPDAPDGLDKLRKSLYSHPNIFYSPESYLIPENVTVLLPKFRLEESVNLKTVLPKMGIRDLFYQGKADLSGIAGSKDLYVSSALHKAFIEVNERGSKAAAVSAVVIRGRMMQSETIFRADHPFMFFIQDRVTKTVLFIGHVKDLPNVEADDQQQIKS